MSFNAYSVFLHNSLPTPTNLAEKHLKEGWLNVDVKIWKRQSPNQIFWLKSYQKAIETEKIDFGISIVLFR